MEKIYHLHEIYIQDLTGINDDFLGMLKNEKAKFTKTYMF